MSRYWIKLNELAAGYAMSDRAQLGLILAFVLGAVAFVGVEVFRATAGRHYTPGAAFVERSGLAQFAANGVRVEVSSESDSQGLPLLRATFTPSDLGFHLYSKDLNTNSTGGIGVATRLELLPNPSVRVDGRLFADARPHLANTLDRNMETYPDGPVSLHLPIQVIGESTNIAARVAVSYMACAEGVCLRPIESQLLDVQIPSN